MKITDITTRKPHIVWTVKRLLLTFMIIDTELNRAGIDGLTVWTYRNENREDEP